MTMQKLKPTSPGRRHVVRNVRKHLSKEGPYKPLTSIKKKHGGRNNNGRITVRHQGGGHKQLYRQIDFKRNKDAVPGKIERIEYDPNRTAEIALVLYQDGERRYIIAPKGIKIGDPVISGSESPIAVGNALPLKSIPVGTIIHCIEMKPEKGAQMCRSAGTSAQIIAREAGYVSIRVKSGEIRKILQNCKAVIGEVSNSDHNLIKLGKAGAKVWRGIRPTVRGVAMNPVDHPHGGGEGRTSGGRHPVTPWGVPTKGKKTRSNKRTSSMIIRRKVK
jgi:large subunit ribosomal protein L2